MRFRKMHGLGNDFVILEQTEVKAMLTGDQIRNICDRHRGVGCDLLTVLEPSSKANVFARFFNADGSESAACGNATRCVADIVMNDLGADECTIETGRGILACTRAENDMVTVNMGAPVKVEELALETGPLNDAIGVDMGNPHCVFFVDNVEDFAIEEWGPQIETHSLFPKRTNVEFVQVLSDGKLRQRTWERGVGVTQACGSGACAVAVAAAHTKKSETPVEIILDGGSLFIDINDDGHILMTGPYTYVFDGVLKAV